MNYCTLWKGVSSLRRHTRKQTIIGETTRGATATGICGWQGAANTKQQGTQGEQENCSLTSLATFLLTIIYKMDDGQDLKRN